MSKEYSRKEFLNYMFYSAVAITRKSNPIHLNKSESIISKICIDADTGKIILQEDAETVRPPASLVKMMLMYLVALKIEKGDISLKDTIKVKKTIFPKNNTDIVIANDKEYTLSFLMDAVAIISSNTSAIAVAQSLWSSEDKCITEMNEKAKKLGMKNTMYATVNGYPVKPGVDLDKTTARDLSILGLQMCKIPLIFSWTSKKKFILEKEGIERDNTNDLLFLTEGCDGIKTGYTKSAGHCIVATAKRANKRVIGVVLGAKKSAERFRVANNLLEIGFAEIG